jgi:hypothetical protein
VVIAIQLKNSQNLSKDPVHQKQILTEDFVKAIEYEYAVRYLQIMGIEASANNIQRLLKEQPLSSCQLTSGWNNSG